MNPGRNILPTKLDILPETISGPIHDDLSSSSPLANQLFDFEPTKLNLQAIDAYLLKLGFSSIDEAIVGLNIGAAALKKIWTDREEKLPIEISSEFLCYFLSEDKALSDLAAVLRGRVRLAAVTKDSAFKEQYSAKIDSALLDVSDAVKEFNIWWKCAPQKIAQQILANRNISDFRPMLARMRMAGPWREEDIVQELVARATTGASHRRYDSHLETLELSKIETPYGRAAVQLTSEDPAARRAAYAAYYGALHSKGTELEGSLGELLQHTHVSFINSRRPVEYYLSSQDHVNPLIDGLQDAFPEICRSFHTYFRAKQQMLGLSEMTFADLLAPLPQQDGASLLRFSYNEAIALSIQATLPLGENQERIVHQMLEEGRIQVVPLADMGIWTFGMNSQVGPLVITAMPDTLENLFHFTHEVPAHAARFMRARTSPFFGYYNSPILQEAESLSAEILLTDHLLDTYHDPLTRKAIAINQMDRLYRATIRSMELSLFERDFCREGIKDLQGLWASRQRQIYGDAVKFDPVFSAHLFRNAAYFKGINEGWKYPVGLLVALSCAENNSWKKFNNLSAPRDSLSTRVLIDRLGVPTSGPAIVGLLNRYMNRLRDIYLEDNG